MLTDVNERGVFGQNYLRHSSAIIIFYTHGIIFSLWL